MPDSKFENRGGRRRGARLLGFLALAGICFGTTPGGTLLSSAYSAVETLGDVLRGRSPGERDDSRLVMTKPMPVDRTQRALPATSEAPPEQEVAQIFPQPIPPATGELGPASLAGFQGDVPAFGVPSAPPLSAFPSFPGVGTGGGGGRGGTGAPPPGTELPGPPGASLPVPEPGTWLMMFSGMFILGGFLRFRLRRKVERNRAARPFGKAQR